MDTTVRPLSISPQRAHLTRMMSIWRSAGWPCRDALELELLAAGWAAQSQSVDGHETIRLTDAGIRLLAESRQRNRRSLSAHDRLAHRVAEHLVATGRIAWRELSLRAQFSPNDEPGGDMTPSASSELWQEEQQPDSTPGRHGHKASWRMARPDVFSVRHTSVEDYLNPRVHEVKASRADLLSDLRHAAKRESYQWLACETYYVFPAGVAELEEIPEAFGVWLLNGSIEDGTLVQARAAAHQPCKLPFFVWMALAKATPVRPEREAGQLQLGGQNELCEPVARDAAPEQPTNLANQA